MTIRWQRRVIKPNIRSVLWSFLIAGMAVGCAACGQSATNTVTKPKIVRSSLASITCSSLIHCVAVGAFLPVDKDAATGDPDGDGQATHTLVEVFNGTTWKVMPSSDAGKGGSALSGVSCAGATCIAVGYYQPKPDTLSAKTPLRRPLIEQLINQKWQRVISPVVAPNSVLLGVDCTTSTACVAVGYSTTNTGKGDFAETSFIESDDNGNWSVTPASFPSSSSTTLSSVSCGMSSSCQAVGNYSTKQDPDVSLPLIETFTNGRWIPATLPQASAGPGILYTVSCSATSCTAVGESETSSSSSEALVLSNAETTWSDVPSATKSEDAQTLVAVGCSTSSCLVGGTSSVSLSARPSVLLANLEANSWKQQSVANASGYVAAIACPTKSECFAVGTINSNTLLVSIVGSTWSEATSPTP